MIGNLPIITAGEGGQRDHTLSRLAVVLRRKRRARAFGIRFPRGRDFRTPDAVRIGGQWIPLQVPDETGIRVALVDIFLDDCYGIGALQADGIRRVVDIGSHVGLFALAARAAFPAATIHCYEPNPAVLDLLEAHASSIACDVYGEAVGRSPGMVRIANGGGDSVQARAELSADGTVPQVAFRTAIARIGGACDLVKLDCEGAEWDILSDGTSWRRVRHLTMEYHLWAGGRRDADVHAALESIGFRIRRHIPSHPGYGIVWASRH